MGGGAELEEGGHDLERERERDAGEGVALGRCGRERKVIGVSSWWKSEGVEGGKEKEGLSASYCLSLGG